jgi:hypothetical protein
MILFGRILCSFIILAQSLKLFDNLSNKKPTFRARGARNLKYPTPSPRPSGERVGARGFEFEKSASFP